MRRERCRELRCRQSCSPSANTTAMPSANGGGTERRAVRHRTASAAAGAPGAPGSSRRARSPCRPTPSRRRRGSGRASSCRDRTRVKRTPPSALRRRRLRAVAPGAVAMTAPAAADGSSLRSPREQYLDAARAPRGTARRRPADRAPLHRARCEQHGAAILPCRAARAGLGRRKRGPNAIHGASSSLSVVGVGSRPNALHQDAACRAKHLERLRLPAGA